MLRNVLALLKFNQPLISFFAIISFDNEVKVTYLSVLIVEYVLHQRRKLRN